MGAVDDSIDFSKLLYAATVTLDRGMFHMKPKSPILALEIMVFHSYY